MDDPVTIVLFGEPVAWARPRQGYDQKTKTIRTDHWRTPKRQRNNAAALRLLAQQEMVGRLPFEGPLSLDVTAEFAIPKSFTKAQRAAALTHSLRPTKRPDLSNIIKQIEDAFNGVVYRDDAQIVEYGRPRKLYGEQPKVTVTVRAIA